ncbi:hypothetical protein [Capnocytophaga leadbetteri]|jgi:hypothetical protein|uniref:hypothetical protein n=1 Tax=Capnocytophaga leadbetteri TaxID=327575 RepID=UPI0028D226CB|nr:hypothetical protein [Capnocytophaga leadbetteri]
MTKINLKQTLGFTPTLKDFTTLKTDEPIISGKDGELKVRKYVEVEFLGYNELTNTLYNLLDIIKECSYENSGLSLGGAAIGNLAELAQKLISNLGNEAFLLDEIHDKTILKEVVEGVYECKGTEEEPGEEGLYPFRKAANM